MPERAGVPSAAADGGEPLTWGRRRLAIFVVPPADRRAVTPERACVQGAVANSDEPLAFRRRRLTQTAASPADGNAVLPERASVLLAAAERRVLLRGAEARRGRGVRSGRRRWREGWSRGWRNPRRPVAAALGRPESGVGRKDGNGHGRGGCSREGDILSRIVEAAEAGPFALTGDIGGLVDARQDLLADAPCSGSERRPREGRLGSGGRRCGGHGRRRGVGGRRGDGRPSWRGRPRRRRGGVGRRHGIGGCVGRECCDCRGRGGRGRGWLRGERRRRRRAEGGGRRRRAASGDDGEREGCCGDGEERAQHSNRNVTAKAALRARSGVGPALSMLGRGQPRSGARLSCLDSRLRGRGGSKG